MDLRSLSLGEKIAAGCGAALFVLLFLSWLEDRSAWELFGIVDVLLAVLALAAVVLPLAKSLGYRSQLSPSDRAVLIRVGAVSLVLILAYFLEALGDAQVGLWLSVLAAAGIFYGATTMPGEEAPSRRRERSRRPLAEQDYEEPPPGMESWRRGGLLDDESEPAGSGSSAADPEPTETRPPRARPERGGGSGGR